MKFQAGLKGIDLEGNETKSKFDEVKARVQKKLADERSQLAGTEAEVIDFEQFGIAVESE